MPLKHWQDLGIAVAGLARPASYIQDVPKDIRRQASSAANREHARIAAVNAIAFALFDTPIGRCAVAWGERGIVNMQLPEATEAAIRARMRRSHPSAGEAEPPAEVHGVIERVAALLAGEAVDLSTVALDMEGVPDFHRSVYALTQQIPRGQTLTYGEIAARLGDPGAARAVGQALGANPFAPVVPCHRVLAACTRLGGFSARGGLSTKLRMLAIEGARVTQAHEPDLFDEA